MHLSCEMPAWDQEAEQSSSLLSYGRELCAGVRTHWRHSAFLFLAQMFWWLEIRRKAIILFLCPHPCPWWRVLEKEFITVVIAPCKIRSRAGLGREESLNKHCSTFHMAGSVHPKTTTLSPEWGGPQSLPYQGKCLPASPSSTLRNQDEQKGGFRKSWEGEIAPILPAKEERKEESQCWAGSVLTECEEFSDSFWLNKGTPENVAMAGTCYGKRISEHSMDSPVPCTMVSAWCESIIKPPEYIILLNSEVITRGTWLICWITCAPWAIECAATQLHIYCSRIDFMDKGNSIPTSNSRHLQVGKLVRDKQGHL